MLWFILILAYIVIGTALFISNIKEAMEKKRAIRAETEPIKATIIEKRRKAMSTTALFEDGNRILLEIPRAAAEYMTVGDVGMLDYYKKIFRSFVRLRD